MGLFFLCKKMQARFAQLTLKFAAKLGITTNIAKIIQEYFPENDRCSIISIYSSVHRNRQFCSHRIPMSILQVSFNKMIVRGDS